MYVPKTLADINQMIVDAVEESIYLDYKAGAALQNNDATKKEIAKDVSAMANSAGGVIVYGVKEFSDEDKKHMPESLSPVDRTTFSKEKLEQIINSNISPKIDGLLIHPITVGSFNEAVYVVEIPQSSIGHQNTRDNKYYKRYNFESVPMQDYEIRDIMNRVRYPIIELEFEIERVTTTLEEDLIARTAAMKFGEPETKTETKTYLRVNPLNTGAIYALYVNYFIDAPESILTKREIRAGRPLGNGLIRLSGNNTHRDVVDMKIGTYGGIPSYGPSRYDPILPGLRGEAIDIELRDPLQLDDREIVWAVHADNTPERLGSIKLSNIPFSERREEDFEDYDE